MNESLPTPKPLQDRVILVTGSSQDIGKAVALDLALHGATVVLLSRNARRLEAVYDEIVAAGGPEPAAIPMDLLETSDEQFEQLALQIYKELGRLDGIVHRAAHLYALSPLRDQRIEEWMNQFRINTVAPFALTRACLPLLARSPDASVVSSVGETHGLKASPYWGAFSVSKAGLSHLTCRLLPASGTARTCGSTCWCRDRCIRPSARVPILAWPRRNCRRSIRCCRPSATGPGRKVPVAAVKSSNSIPDRVFFAELTSCEPCFC